MCCRPEACLNEACVGQVWKRIGVRHQLKKLPPLSPQRRTGRQRTRRNAEDATPNEVLTPQAGILLGLPLRRPPETSRAPAPTKSRRVAGRNLLAKRSHRADPFNPVKSCSKLVDADQPSHSPDRSPNRMNEQRHYTALTFPNTLDNNHQTPTPPMMAGMPNLIQ
jgi:hypothetical protein